MSWQGCSGPGCQQEVCPCREQGEQEESVEARKDALSRWQKFCW